MKSLAVPAALVAAACTLPPLRGLADIGKDPYAVFVARGTGGTDLYVARGDASEVVPITFTPVTELAPALSPDGATVAFLRQPWPLDSAAGRTAWLLNLLSGAERELRFPPKVVARPERIGWSADGASVFVETDRGIWRFAAPPAAPEPRLIAAGDRAAADSAFMTLLGDPAFARAERCGDAADAVCVIGRDGGRTVVARGARGPARWGPDSIGFFTPNGFEVRPLGPGRSRIVEWRPAPGEPGELTYFPGK